MAPLPGGGGLVILPHKSWNVWNRDNKEKVARDEKANALLIEAKNKCQQKILHEIRFEKLNGKIITKQEEEKRIKYALDNININDWIKDETLQNIAKNINDRINKEKEEGHEPNKRKRKKFNLTEQEIKYRPRKRHKRNDICIIEDHYNQKSSFQFDPNQYNNNNNNNSNNSNNNNNNMNKKDDNNRHFSLFKESDLKNKYNQNGTKNQQRIKEDKMENQHKDYQFKFGRTEIESRKTKKPWYLMTNKREMNRRMLMKSDSIQRSLPKRLKDYNQTTDYLQERSVNNKNINDPLHLMNKYLDDQHKQKKKQSLDDNHDYDKFDMDNNYKSMINDINSLKQKEKLKKQKKKLKDKIRKEQKYKKKKKKKKRKSDHTKKKHHKSSKRKK